ncbi:hypothetical protein AMIS_36860 [Actinoplanes missouriensis 431]|uniref:Uncharacterized protein n=1 Tax=Actinoplanes missouriensis (strain ATCC 14538 / DSM 43046 / CBS 188.64 / JCM 3121 / NBRC 102363 / NCIMB 12654 / NRRL B-3342 / UNCC 431) TaxID=512565 RepID=I0H7B9_ACTM4|nr:hypothetical protein [Actinoplanes missouriensis]BAL88906.1 hypothetical protein AMIS_36860 [Actinoplanes missouriensis 431]
MAEISAERMRPCRRCGHPTRVDRMIQGYGRNCATLLGLVGGTVDTGHSGPDLLDLLGRSPTPAEPFEPEPEPEDECDGGDRPADAPVASGRSTR